MGGGGSCQDNRSSLRLLVHLVCVFVQLRQLEMQLEQEYEEKQMVIHEKHDLEGLIATLCDQVHIKHTLTSTLLRIYIMYSLAPFSCLNHDK